MKRLLLLLLLTALPVFAGDVTGAHANVVLSDGHYDITITNESTRNIPIIALTAHALITDRAKAFEVGCDDYDTKPVEFGRLREKIESLLAKKK